MMRVVALLALAALAQGSEQGLSANPIRKVVNLLQGLQKKVKEEGEKEEELYKKFMCYCKTGVAELRTRIDEAGEKGPQLEASIKESEEQLVQTKQDLKTAQAERSEAKTAVATATEIREKEAAKFAETKAELTKVIEQITGAVKAIEAGAAGDSFLQTSVAASLKKIIDRVPTSAVSDDDKIEVLSFLSGKQGYAPQSGEVTGILKQMGDEFAKTLKEAEETEATAIKEFEALVAAKKKEIDTLTASIEAKLEKVGELGTSIVQMKADFEDIAGNLLEDKKLLKELEKGCSTKDAEYEERVKIRTEELAAIADTIKILNDDDALELFKKTLPAPSLVQIQVTEGEVRDRAIRTLRKAAPGSARARRHMNFLLLALRGKKMGFDKVILMIDDMVELLKKEGQDDADKKEYCEAQFDSTEDKKKELDRILADTEAAIDAAKGEISTLAEEIPEVEKSIKELDAQVKEATEIRKEESEEYEAEKQQNSAAKELLGFAKNRLNKFYNPKLYKPPAKEELSSGDAIARDMSFVQIKAHSQAAMKVEPPPETWDAYSKKSEESTGVISMIDLLIKDLDKELTESAVEEKNAQEEYDKTIAESKKDRVGLSKSLKEKSAAKADLEEDLETLKATKKSTTTELMGVEKMISDLHGECDWLLKYFDVRAEARAGEIDALGKAKAVLSGADYSLLQTRNQRRMQ